VVAAGGLAALIWTITATDIDAPAATALVGVCTAIATVLVVILQRTRAVEHEVKPNSGSSMKDQTNRIEAMVQTLIFDVGGLRQENRDDRRAEADRFALLEGRVRDLEHPKEKP
jgi:hypothetical protein